MLFFKLNSLDVAVFCAITGVESTAAEAAVAAEIKLRRFIMEDSHRKDSILDLEMKMQSDREELLKLVHYKMPYGKFKDSFLVDLPLPYLVWFKQQGFPKGKLGEYLEVMLTIKENGLEPLIRKLQKEYPLS